MTSTAPTPDTLITRIDKLLAIDASPEAWCVGANVLLHLCKAELHTQAQRITELEKEQKANNDWLDSLYENAGVGHD